MGEGTEAFEDLGRHCEQEDCRQLDFLPFKCDGCLKVFCLEHRTCKAHACPEADHRSRVVVVCDTCSAAIEKKRGGGGGGESDADALRRHARSGGCDPAAKKRKPRCPVKGCREQLTFSNTSTCGSCHQNLCLKHRFQDAHTCNPAPAAAATRDKFFLALEGRVTGGNCGERKPQRKPSPPPIEAC